MCVCMCTLADMHAHTLAQATHALVCIWKPENNLRGLILSFYSVNLGVGSRLSAVTAKAFIH